MKKKRIAVIGGGAAGMMSAATIVEQYPTAEVFLYEKNASLGKKVIISGGGRCNVTTGIEDVAIVLAKYPRGSKFLQSAMRHFAPSDVRAWFEEHGVPLKCEADYRVFPVSDNGRDIVGVFEKIFQNPRVQVVYNAKIENIKKTDRGFLLYPRGGESVEVDAVILALGGQAYRQTGSTGDGYVLAETTGHTITPLAASLNSFITLEKWPRTLSGVSFERATISAPIQKKYSHTGPFLFTHLGVSGPAVFALSSLVAFETYNQQQPLKILIDLIPDISADELLGSLKKSMAESPKKSFKNTLHQFVPQSVAEAICVNINVPSTQKNAETTRQALEQAVAWLKKMPLSAVGRGAGDEFVTAGGVNLSEVDPRTLESKICPGLYFAGEILDIDGYTGGFNLQASWATGRAAGVAAGID